jgi:hypothetical protein
MGVLKEKFKTDFRYGALQNGTHPENLETKKFSIKGSF